MTNKGSVIAQVRIDDKCTYIGTFHDKESAEVACTNYKIKVGILTMEGKIPTITEVVKYVDGVLLYQYKVQRHQIGDIAGSSRRGDGYIIVCYRRQRFFAHRLTWEIHFGKIPEGMEIDHIDGDKQNNRIENLRLVNRLGNARNLSRQRRNRTGVAGVIFANNRYRVTIGSHYLGYFDTLDEAVSVRKNAEKLLNYHTNHGRKYHENS